MFYTIARTECCQYVLRGQPGSRGVLAASVMDRLEGRWWQPAELLAAAHAIRTSVPPDEFFCDPSYQQVREAIAAGWFAQRRPWNKDWTIRLVPRREELPDVQLRSGNEVRGFEIVEADLTNRRRCDEYRRAKGLPPKAKEHEAWALRERFGRKFESAWLLWQDGTFRLWPKPASIRRA
jgi:hypothetical protein